jgi:protein-S-isoprenylcysteine O-methyltransferase Ste14
MNLELPTPGLAIGVAWLAWVVSWLIAAAWTRTTLNRAGYWREFPGRLVVLIGGALLFVPLATGYGVFPALWNTSDAVGWTVFAGVLAGIAFAWWARLHLGALWSGTVTRKEDHRIVDSGPYGIVRHPIYSGLLFSMWMTAFERGQVEPLAGAVLLSVGLWMQARLEEHFLSQELGAAEYASYSVRVPMLAPLLKGRTA